MENDLSKSTRIVKNTILLYVRMAIVMVVNLYTTRVVLENLGVDDYGIYNVIYGFVIMFSTFNVTLTAGINRYYNYAIGKQGISGVRKVYNIAIRIQIIFILIVFILIECLGTLYVNHYMVMPINRVSSANWLLQLVAISMLFILLQNPYSSLIMAFEKMNYFALVSVFDAILKLCIALSLKYAPGDKLVFYGVLMLLLSILDFAAYIIYNKVKFSKCIILEKSIDNKTFKDMLCFSGWMALDPIAYSINGQGVNMLINIFFGTVINTAFGIANQVGQAIDSFGMNISTAFRPQLVQSYAAGEKQRCFRLFFSMSKISFSLFLLICVPLVMNIKFIYDFWLGSSYPNIAITISVIFIFVKMVGCLNHPISYLIMAKGHLNKYMTSTCIVTSSIIIFSYLFLICGAPVNSVFILMLIIAILNQIISVIVLSEEIPDITTSLYCKKIAFPCVFLSIAVFSLVFWSHSLIKSDLFKLLSDFIVSSMATVILSYTICLDNTEKIYCKSFFKRLFV